MKKVLSTALILGALYTQANALEVKPYAGVDFGFNLVDGKELMGEDGKTFNVGINAGSNFYFNDSVFAGLEAYYRFLDIYDEKSQKDEDGDIVKLTISNPWGAKVYAGYQFNSDISAFLSYGLNRYEAELKGTVYGEFAKEERERFAQSFGFGVNYNIMPNLEARFTYDYVMLEWGKAWEDTKSNSNVFNLGVNYLF